MGIYDNNLCDIDHYFGALVCTVSEKQTRVSSGEISSKISGKRNIKGHIKGKGNSKTSGETNKVRIRMPKTKTKNACISAICRVRT